MVPCHSRGTQQLVYFKPIADLVIKAKVDRERSSICALGHESKCLTEGYHFSVESRVIGDRDLEPINLISGCLKGDASYLPYFPI